MYSLKHKSLAVRVLELQVLYLQLGQGVWLVEIQEPGLDDVLVVVVAEVFPSAFEAVVVGDLVGTSGTLQLSQPSLALVYQVEVDKDSQFC